MLRVSYGDITLINIFESRPFLVELDRIFSFSEMKNINNFSEDDYLYFLYLVGHWERLFKLLSSASDDIILEEENNELDKYIEERKLGILKKISEIKGRYGYLDEKFDYKFLEEKFFQKYERFSNQLLGSGDD